MTDVLLLPNVTNTDLPVFFENQQNPQFGHRAAFTPKDPSNARGAEVEEFILVLSA